MAGHPVKHRNEVWRARFSPDGRRVVTASYDGTAQVWDAELGEPIGPPMQHGGIVRIASFSLDGRRALTAGDNGTARVWDLPRDDRPLADLVLLAQLLPGHRIDVTSGLVPIEPAAFLSAWETLRSKYPRDFAPR